MSLNSLIKKTFVIFSVIFALGMGQAVFAQVYPPDDDAALPIYTTEDIHRGIIDQSISGSLTICKNSSAPPAGCGGIVSLVATPASVGVGFVNWPDVDTAYKLHVKGRITGAGLCFGTSCKNVANPWIDSIQAGTGLSGGGTSGAIMLSIARPVVTCPDNKFIKSFNLSSGTTPNATVICTYAPPSVTTVAVNTTSPDEVTGTTALLRGAARPNAPLATGWFRYHNRPSPGTCDDTNAFGTRVPSSGGISLSPGANPLTDQIAYSHLISGLSKETTYHYCAIASNEAGTRRATNVLNFKTDGPPKDTETVSATNTTPTSATLNGKTTPNGAATTGWFRYSTTNPITCNDTFGTRSSTSPSLGNGNSSVPYSLGISGLINNATYYYCAIASNAEGTHFGSIKNFVADYPPPTVTTTGANYTHNNATLNGSANPNGYSTTGWFRYCKIGDAGCVTAPPSSCNNTFGIRAPSSGGTSLGLGNSPVSYSRGISVSPSTTYYYCAIAQNDSSTLGYGSVVQFTTPAPPVNLTVNSSGASGVWITYDNTNYTRTFAAGDFVSLSAPLSHGTATFSSWSGCDSVSGSGNRTCNLTVNSTRTVTANYTPPPTLTVNSSGASGVSISGTYSGTTNYSRTLNVGTPVSLTAPTSQGATAFSSWSGCDNTTNLGRTCNLTVNSNRTVTANYTGGGTGGPGPDPCVGGSGPELGRIHNNSGGGAPFKCFNGDHANFTQISCTGWGGDNTTCNDVASSITVASGNTMTLFEHINYGGAVSTTYTAGTHNLTGIWNNSASSVKFNYTDTPILTVNSSGASSVPITSGTGHGGTTNYTGNVAAGTTVALVAPNTHSGQTFSSWSGSGCSSTNRNISFTMPSSNRTCTANYTTITCGNGLSLWSQPNYSGTCTNTTLDGSPGYYPPIWKSAAVTSGYSARVFTQNWFGGSSWLVTPSQPLSSTGANSITSYSIDRNAPLDSVWVKTGSWQTCGGNGTDNPVYLRIRNVGGESGVPSGWRNIHLDDETNNDFESGSSYTYSSNNNVVDINIYAGDVEFRMAKNGNDNWFLEEFKVRNSSQLINHTWANQCFNANGWSYSFIGRKCAYDENSGNPPGDHENRGFACEYYF